MKNILEKANTYFTENLHGSITDMKNMQRIIDLFVNKYGFEIVELYCEERSVGLVLEYASDKVIFDFYANGKVSFYVSVFTEEFEFCDFYGNPNFAPEGRCEYETSGYLSAEDIEECYKNFMQDQGLASLVG